MAAEARFAKTQEKVDAMVDAVREAAETLRERASGIGDEDPESAFRRERAEAREAHLELSRDGREARDYARLIQELVAKETTRSEDAKDRQLMRWITGGSFVATLVFSLLAARYQQLWGFAGMGTSALFFGGGLFRLKLRGDR